MFCTNLYAEGQFTLISLVLGYVCVYLNAYIQKLILCVCYPHGKLNKYSIFSYYINNFTGERSTGKRNRVECPSGTSVVSEPTC